MHKVHVVVIGTWYIPEPAVSVIASWLELEVELLSLSSIMVVNAHRIVDRDEEDD